MCTLCLYHVIMAFVSSYKGRLLFNGRGYNMPEAIIYLIIYLSRTVDVSLGVFRMILLVRGRRLLAAFVGFFEVSIFILILGTVVTDFTNYYYLLFYCLGFSTGNYLGAFIEDKLAMGYCSIQVIAEKNGKDLAEILRSCGFAVTSLPGEGKDGPRQVLNLAIKRKCLPEIMKIINDTSSKSFVTIMDTRRTHGGFFPAIAKKY